MADKKADKSYLEPPADLGYFEHLYEYLFEIGPTAGDNALDWPQLDSWQRVTGIELTPFQAGAIVALSREFLAALGKARDPLCTLAALLDE